MIILSRAPDLRVPWSTINAWQILVTKYSEAGHPSKIQRRSAWSRGKSHPSQRSEQNTFFKILLEMCVTHIRDRQSRDKLASKLNFFLERFGQNQKTCTFTFMSFLVGALPEVKNQFWKQFSYKVLYNYNSKFFFLRVSVRTRKLALSLSWFWL